MRSDLAKLNSALAVLQRNAGQVGTWDVGQQVGPKVDSAHQNMVSAINAYCRAYEAMVSRVEQSARNYGAAESAAKAASEGAGRQAGPPTGVTPWRTR
ncbi:MULTISPECIES: hypothetical protein [Actinomadura]|uniref:WXG100 family type VII secretion target n=1 Tax=Actinomadura yumaensis TaxID=111807 RepID=A0ABW2CNN3_9ACTN|nr:hypothetical protein [Actinomadura sp. J1-007]MWK34240.1 hypothetical protein [Actinomadura sp. J1-007]